jgi:hypothetical protein
MVDGRIVTATPGENLRRGEAAKVPLVRGTTSQNLPVTFPPSTENPLSFFGPADLMHFTPDNGPVVGPDPWKECLDLVERVAEAQTPSQNAPANLVGWEHLPESMIVSQDGRSIASRTFNSCEP